MCQTWGRIRMRICIAYPEPDRHQHQNSDPIPDRLQNNAEPQHCLEDKTFFYCETSVVDPDLMGFPDPDSRGHTKKLIFILF
jgi:hypothetical protein